MASSNNTIRIHNTLGSAYPPPPQKYARLSVAVPKRKEQDEEIIAPLSTFRSFGFISKKKPKQSPTNEQGQKQRSKFSFTNCCAWIFRSKCCQRKKPQEKEPDFFVYNQPDHRQELTLPEFAVYMANSNRKFLLSEMEDTRQYRLEKHCWREWGYNRAANLLSHEPFELKTLKKSIYQPPRLTEYDVNKIYRGNIYLKEGWDLWAKIRYPNGNRPHGPPLP